MKPYDAIKVLDQKTTIFGYMNYCTTVKHTGFKLVGASYLCTSNNEWELPDVFILKIS